jgi:pyruvate kinase
MGAYPDKAVGVLRSVALRMEEWVRQEKFGGVVLPQVASTPDGRVSEEVRSCSETGRQLANKCARAGGGGRGGGLMLLR